MVYTADEVQEMLHIGRNSIYDYLGEVYREQYPFRVIKIGKQYRIPKASFDKWIQSDIWTKVKKLKGLNIKFKPFEFLSEAVLCFEFCFPDVYEICLKYLFQYDWDTELAE